MSGLESLRSSPTCRQLCASGSTAKRRRGFSPVGSKAPELLMTLAGLREELAGLEFQIARELKCDVTEGTGHTGHGAVVQILARKV